MIAEQQVGWRMSESGVQAPVGLAGIVREFGEIGQFVEADGELDPRWESKSLMRLELPFSLLLAWDRSKTIAAFRCHRRLRGIFGEVFARILAAGLAPKVTTFGGCFMYRPQRSGTKLSTHSWGIAIDLNPETNRLGTAGDMDLGVVAIFREAGFEWGGEWKGRGRDAMHFQFCSGY